MNKKFPGNVSKKELSNEYITKRYHFSKYVSDSSLVKYGKLGEKLSGSINFSVCAHIGHDYVFDIKSLSIPLIDFHKHVPFYKNSVLNQNYIKITIIQHKLYNEVTLGSELLSASQFL